MRFKWSENKYVGPGCKVNLITSKTWETLKSQGAKLGNQVPKPNKTLFAYGSNTPLNVKLSFETLVTIKDQEEHATIFVIEGGTRDLLGKDTATSLGVLKISLEIDNVDEEYVVQPFPKLRDMLVETPTDNTIKPMSQPYRRIPIPIEGKVVNKI